jgi:hypothetical protein
VKLPDHVPELPGKVISFYIVPPDPPEGGAWRHVPVKKGSIIRVSHNIYSKTAVFRYSSSTIYILSPDIRRRPQF